MFANGFQDMLMIKTGDLFSGKAMGKPMGQSSDSKSLGNAFTSVLDSLMGKAAGTKAIGEKNLAALMNITDIPGKKTTAVLSKLGGVLTGDDAANAAGKFVDAQGLDALSGLLEQAGFDPEKVKTFIEGKKADMGNGYSQGLPLQTLLPALGEFMQSNDQGPVLDMSALPFVQSALNNFGFDASKVSEILDKSISDSQEEGLGIDVEKLLAEIMPYTTSGGMTEAKTAVENGLTVVTPAMKTTDQGLSQGVKREIPQGKKQLELDIAVPGIPLKTSSDAPFVLTGKEKSEKAATDKTITVETLTLKKKITSYETAAKTMPVENNLSSTQSNPVTTDENTGPVENALKTLFSGETVKKGILSDGSETPLPSTRGNEAAAIIDRVLAAMKNEAAPKDTESTAFLDDAAKGKLGIDQFAAKLDALASGNSNSSGSGASQEKQAKTFGEHIHGLKRNVMAEGKEAYVTLDVDQPATSHLSFESKNPLPQMTKAETAANKVADAGSEKVENPWASRNVSEYGLAATDGKAGVKKDAGTPDDSAFKFTQSEKNVTSGADTANSHAAIGDKAVREKTAIAKDNGEAGAAAVKNLGGTGISGRTGETVGAQSNDKTLPAYVTDQVARQISKAIRNGDSEVKFHIKPPDMGRVELSIASTANGLKISIVTEHGTTRDMIMNQASDLKTILADQGIKIEKMDVGLSGQFGQSMSQARNDSDQSSRNRKHKDKPLFSMDSIVNETRQNPVNRLMAAGRTTRGVLDLVA